MSTGTLPFRTVSGEVVEPDDVFEILNQESPGHVTTKTTSESGYDFVSSVPQDWLSGALQRVSSGDLSHIITRMVVRIKLRASELIVAVAPLTSQINRLARAADLYLQWLEGTPPTTEEMAELQAGRALYRDFVRRIRARSNELEAALIGMTRAELMAAEATDWPDEVWQ